MPVIKRILLLGILVLAPLTAQANDSSFEGVGGSWRPTRGENAAIRMVRETVVLTANANDYSTQADFVFTNETARAQNVSMGFPEGNFGDVPEGEVGFKGFVTTVDGQRTDVKRTHLKEADASGFDVYWLKTVSFAPRQTRKVRVQFRSPYSSTTSWGMTKALSYSFTGGNWRGNVGESVLAVRVPQNGLWRGIGLGSKSNILPFITESDKNGATFRRAWKNWNAQETVTFGLERVIPFWRKDSNGLDSGELTMKTVLGSQTVRAGDKPNKLEASQGFPTEGFTYNNVFYVGVDYLASKLEAWGDAQTPKIKVESNFSPLTGFDLRAGKSRLRGREGQSVMRINGKTVALGAPILANTNSGTKMRFVPLAPVARELGWKSALKGDRLFTLDRGTWRG